LSWMSDLEAEAAKAKADIGAFNSKVKTVVIGDATKVKAAVAAHVGAFNNKVKAVVVADATKVKTAVVANATKLVTPLVTGAADAWKAVSTDLILDGKKCGTNPICQELSRYGVNVNHHIDHLVIQQWLKTGQYGQWCASSNICMDAVKEAQHKFTHGERQAVNKWLHPAHTTESLLQELGWWADIKAEAAKAKADLAAFNAKVKADAAKALLKTEAAAKIAEAVAKTVGHDVLLAGEKCGSNKICTEIAMQGLSMAENKENAMVMGWINTNQKAAWCKSNNICMAIVNKALTTATGAEDAAINKWLHTPTMILMMI